MYVWVRPRWNPWWLVDAEANAVEIRNKVCNIHNSFVFSYLFYMSVASMRTINDRIQYTVGIFMLKFKFLRLVLWNSVSCSNLWIYLNAQCLSFCFRVSHKSSTPFKRPRTKTQPREHVYWRECFISPRVVL